MPAVWRRTRRVATYVVGVLVGAVTVASVGFGLVYLAFDRVLGAFYRYRDRFESRRDDRPVNSHDTGDVAG